MQDSARGRHSATAAAAVTVPAAAAATVPAAVAATVPQKEESLEAMVSQLRADNVLEVLEQLPQQVQLLQQEQQGGARAAAVHRISA